MSADELAEFADEALGELKHRRVDFDRIAAAEPVRRASTSSAGRPRG